MTVNKNASFSGYTSIIRLPDCSKLAINQKNDNDVTICWHESSSFFWRWFVNIATGSGVMTIQFCKGLTRDPETGNTSGWVSPNIWRLQQVRDAKFGTDVSNKMLLHAAKYQGYNFDRFWVIRGKPTGGGGGKITQITVK